jgi:metal-responsive CopG/Arc/MetJ family transcriptional regulator
MTVRTLGVSLRPEVVERLDELAKIEGISRSAMIDRLVQREDVRKVPEVTVDGRRFVPAIGKR